MLHVVTICVLHEGDTSPVGANDRRIGQSPNPTLTWCLWLLHLLHPQVQLLSQEYHQHTDAFQTTAELSSRRSL